jgi:hypothetical protein
MADRPILFSGPMVRAILSGAKTQTRRLVSPRFLGLFGEPDCWEPQHYATWRAWCHHTNQIEHFANPFGVSGDRLWVRETWGVIGDIRAGNDGEHFAAHVEYAADLAKRTIDVHMDHWRTSYETLGKWRPSIHMPRWASRLTLEVMSVRVERLHDLSEEDARAEGVEVTNGHPELGALIGAGPSYREGFAQLWRSINGPGSWEANPWLWCVAFRRAG